jgi:arylsulfatase A-like enzyme
MPFIARWPDRIPAGRVDATTVLAAVDMLPTLCAIAGAALPSNLKPDGMDVSSAIFGKPLVRNKGLFWEYGRNPKSFAYPPGRDRSPSIAVLDGKWKLLVNADGNGAELYDLQADPIEEKNLASEQPDLTQRLTTMALDTFHGRPYAKRQ